MKFIVRYDCVRLDSDELRFIDAIDYEAAEEWAHGDEFTEYKNSCEWTAYREYSDECNDNDDSDEKFYSSEAYQNFIMSCTYSVTLASEEDLEFYSDL